MFLLFQNLFSPPRHMILLILAAWIGLTLSEKRTDRHGVNKDDLNNITFYSLLTFIIGGRLSFVLQNISTFIKTPAGILSINPDIFDPSGGIAIALIVTLVYGQRRRLSLWPALDSLTPFFAILSIGIGLSHLAAGTAFGKETDLPWGIELWNASRHPTQIYETLASLLIFCLLWLRRQNRLPGILFLTFASLTAASHLFIQAFRGDSALIFYSLNQSQFIAWVILAACFLTFELRYTQTKSAG